MDGIVTDYRARWNARIAQKPTDVGNSICRVATENLDEFIEAAVTVGHTRDGAVIISTDGTVQEQKIRIKM